ncbi:hypothetical protein D6D13_08125 [Aureobasidium pullulans]|uniref:Ubiquitin-like domain-containing protein n=1 Tax=Aureobasidium pullulans TaxID=5580 RepID=A0A4S9C7M8_AURPU|nr:hypothetical protein D6D13_08125 [Aureobasidium pullulans]
MYDLTEDMFDNESVAASSTGMMTPTSTVTGDLTDVEKHEPTITILLTISPFRNSEKFDIKLRQNMPFGNLVQILKAKFDPSFTEGFVLQMYVSPTGPGYIPSSSATKWRIVFDSDTAASVRLAGV